MEKEVLEKAISSDKPLNAMYSLIPEGKKKSFLRFARVMGMSEKKIQEILDSENKK